MYLDKITIVISDYNIPSNNSGNESIKVDEHENLIRIRRFWERIISKSKLQEFIDINDIRTFENAFLLE